MSGPDRRAAEADHPGRGGQRARCRPDIEPIAKVADLVLVPCRPSVLDLFAINQTVATIKSARVPAGIVLNACPSRRGAGEAAVTVDAAALWPTTACRSRPRDNRRARQPSPRAVGRPCGESSATQLRRAAWRSPRSPPFGAALMAKPVSFHRT